MHLGDTTQASYDLAANIKTIFDSGALRQIQQHRCQHIVLIIQAYATDQIRGILTIGQQLGRLIGRTTLRQGVYRGTLGSFIRESIGMDGNKEVRLVLARLFFAIGKFNKMVAITNHQRPHTIFFPNQLFQTFGNR